VRFAAWRIWLSIAAGIALALAYPDFNLPPFAWVAVAGLMLACLGASIGGAALYGLLFSAPFYGFSVPWIYTVMRQYGPLPVWQAAGVMALMILAVSPCIVIFAILVAWIARRSAESAILASPFLWVALEFLRGRVPDIGFPWNLLGYTAAGSLALVQLTSLTGIWGLSLVVAAYNALLVWSIRSLGRRHANRSAAMLVGSTVAILIIVFVGGRFVPVAQATNVAHLIQPDLPQSMEYPANWDALHAGDMADVDQITISAGQREPGLVVWPEVPAPFSLEQLPFAQRALRLARESRSDFLLGVIKWKQEGGNNVAAYNSAVLLDPSGVQEFEYDKIHLVPFSEYVPWRKYLFFARGLTGLIGDFRHGTQYNIGRLPGGPFGVFICYEAIFPNEVRRFVQSGAELLINISDDGWFGRSSARGQHLAMARVRAVENRRWLLRDTNNGFTVAVDPYGRIVAALPPDIRGQLDAPYAFRSDRTLYTRWGDWLAWLVAAIGATLLFAAFRAQLAGE
jgi:apolipoprotein N-acyltransferase